MRDGENGDGTKQTTSSGLRRNSPRAVVTAVLLVLLFAQLCLWISSLQALLGGGRSVPLVSACASAVCGAGVLSVLRGLLK